MNRMSKDIREGNRVEQVCIMAIIVFKDNMMRATWDNLNMDFWDV